MSKQASLLEDLRVQYEVAGASIPAHADVETVKQIDFRLRNAFHWLEKAVTYLDRLQLPIEHRFDLGHGVAFDGPRFSQGSVGKHTRRNAGFPVLDEINVYYEISAMKSPTIEVGRSAVGVAQKFLDDAGLQYITQSAADESGAAAKCCISVRPVIAAMISFHADYLTGLITVVLVNVDRFDRVALEFPSRSIDDDVLEDLVRLILGRDDSFLHRAPLAGVHGKVSTELVDS
jgi:hypothetical protein